MSFDESNSFLGFVRGGQFRVIAKRKSLGDILKLSLIFFGDTSGPIRFLLVKRNGNISPFYLIKVDLFVLVW
jgi:hypothetical protein